MTNIRNFDINLLIAFNILLEECSVTRCAIRLNLTQPTVSNTLSRLRLLFNDPLFIRTRHGLIPTSRALALEPELKEILGSIESLVAPKVFNPKTSEAEIVISSNDYMQYALLAPTAIAMLKKAPNLRIAIKQAEITDLYEMMNNGLIDIAVTIPEFSDARLQSQHLYNEKYVVVMRNNHPVEASKLSMEKFLYYDHVIVSPTKGQYYGPTDIALEKLKLKRNVVISVSSFLTLIEVVEHSNHLALIPMRLYRKFSDRLRMAQPPLNIEGFEAVAVWHAKTDADPVRKWVVNEIQSISNESNHSDTSIIGAIDR